MKRVSLNFIIGITAFVLSAILTAVWILYRETPDVPAPNPAYEKIIEESSKYGSNLSASDRKSWERDILQKFKEKPLNEYSSRFDEIYRLTLEPTFDKPLVIRLNRKNNDYSIVIKKLDGEGGFGLEKFGKLFYEKERSLSIAEWEEFKKLLEKSYFAYLPTFDSRDEPIPDGAFWVMERFDSGKYQDVRRITPNRELSETYGYLLKLAGLKEEYKGYLSDFSED